MSVTRPSTVLRDLAALVEGATPYEASGPQDVFTWVPTFDDADVLPERAFTIDAASLDPITELSCPEWDLVVTIRVGYADTNHSHGAEASGSAARVLEDARVIELALRGIRSESYCSDYEALDSATEQTGSAIIHSRTVRVRYVEGS